METARAEFREGKAQRERGDVAGALVHFKAANALAGTPITALELARTHVLLGQLVEARELCLSVRGLRRRPTESEKGKAARDDAEKLAAELDPRIPSLTIRVEGTPRAVTLDGVPVPADTLAVARKVNPGEHEVVVRAAGGRAESVRVTLKEGETKEARVVLPAPAAEPGPAPPPLPVLPPASSLPPVVAPPPPPSLASPHAGPVAVTGFVVAGTGTIVGAIFGSMALQKASVVHGECMGLVCGKAGYSDVQAGRLFGNVANVALGVAGAGLVVGIVGLFVPASPSPRAALSIEPFAGGLRATGRF
jgi:hypothetical protein